MDANETPVFMHNKPSNTVILPEKMVKSWIDKVVQVPKLLEEPTRKKPEKHI